MEENSNINKSDGFLLKVLEEILYITFVVGGFYLAFLVKFGIHPSSRNFDPFLANIPFIVIASLVVFYVYEIVSTLKKSLFENAVTIVLSLFLIDLATIAIVFFNRGFAFPRSVFVLGFFIQFVLILSTKMVILSILKARKISKKILVIAKEIEASDLSEKIRLDRNNFDEIECVVEAVDKDIFKFIDRVDKVFIGSDIKSSDKLKIIEYCTVKNKKVYLIPGLFEISLVGFKVSQIDDSLIFRIDDMRLTFEQRLFKRIMDTFISVVGLLITLPILAVIAIAIKLYDGGPVLFKQERVTENNKTFNLYKFRTMIVDAEKDTGPVLASEKDPRITPLGNFMRATRIDEIPQLINVLKGDMSIVGPRPERPFFVEQFNEEIEGYKYRVFVKAGITGLAQVLSSYSTDPQTKARYDLFYIKNYSLLLDIKILFNTVKIMFLKESSKGLVGDSEDY